MLERLYQTQQRIKSTQILQVDLRSSFPPNLRSHQGHHRFLEL